MATSILETVRKNLGFPALQKIDPNIQEAKDIDAVPKVNRLAQAAVPAVLTAIFTMTRTEDGAHELVSGDRQSGWFPVILRGHENEAVAKVAQYAGTTEEEARTCLEEVADEAVVDLKQEVGENASYEKVRDYMNGQRHHILVYLPAALNMGHMLNDETLDDRTNKMEGPVSTFMHKLEDHLSDGESTKGTF
jgi:hypothetical protein